MKTIIFTICAILFLLPVCVQAVPITIEISGNITSVGGDVGSIPETIYAGASFTGTYTYNGSTSDSDSDPQRGEYIHNSPYGINIVVGGYEFKTAPNHVGQFKIGIANDYNMNGVHDFYSVLSEYQNISVPSVGFDIYSIRWGLRDNTLTALSSDTLPVTAPVLTDWGGNALTISGSYGPDGHSLSIYGTVTQAVLIPEPFTGVLMAMGIFFLRRRR